MNTNHTSSWGKWDRHSVPSSLRNVLWLVQIMCLLHCPLCCKLSTARWLCPDSTCYAWDHWIKERRSFTFHLFRISITPSRRKPHGSNMSLLSLLPVSAATHFLWPLCFALDSSLPCEYAQNISDCRRPSRDWEFRYSSDFSLNFSRAKAALRYSDLQHGTFLYVPTCVSMDQLFWCGMDLHISERDGCWNVDHYNPLYSGTYFPVNHILGIEV